MKFDVSTFDDIKTFLPKYLSEEQQKKLFDELKSFPENIDKRFYTDALQKEKILFQGDAFSDIKMPKAEDETFKNVKGFLVSNTCDSSLENKRLYSAYLSFAPIISLQKYEDGLIANNHSQDAVKAHLEAIKQQKVSPFFFLPSNQNIKEDCFVRLDCVFSLSASKELIEHLSTERLFTLSNYGFYMLLFKLSVHTARIQESVDRDEGKIL